MVRSPFQTLPGRQERQERQERQSRQERQCRPEPTQSAEVLQPSGSRGAAHARRCRGSSRSCHPASRGSKARRASGERRIIGSSSCSRLAGLQLLPHAPCSTSSKLTPSQRTEPQHRHGDKPHRRPDERSPESARKRRAVSSEDDGSDKDDGAGAARPSGAHSSACALFHFAQTTWATVNGDELMPALWASSDYPLSDRAVWGGGRRRGESVAVKARRRRRRVGLLIGLSQIAGGGAAFCKPCHAGQRPL